MTHFPVLSSGYEVSRGVQESAECCLTSSYSTFLASNSSLMRFTSCFSFKVVAVLVVYRTTPDPLLMW